MFGWDEHEVLGKPFPPGADDSDSGFEEALAGRLVAGYETRRRRKDGSVVDVNVWTTALRDQQSEVSGIMAVVADVTERKAAEAKINYLAHHDTLTGLPNRVSFEERLAEEVAHAARLSVMFLSLDRFKKFNDTLGHTIGDRLLKSVAERLRAAVRDGDTVARCGSDEFAFLLTRIDGADEAARAAREFQRVLEPVFDVEATSFTSRPA